jgi:hypothetical protein
MRRKVPPKLPFLQEPRSVTSQKTAFFIVTAVKTSNLTETSCVLVLPLAVPQYSNSETFQTAAVELINYKYNDVWHSVSSFLLREYARIWSLIRAWRKVGHLRNKIKFIVRSFRYKSQGLTKMKPQEVPGSLAITASHFKAENQLISWRREQRWLPKNRVHWVFPHTVHDAQHNCKNFWEHLADRSQRSECLFHLQCGEVEARRG